MRLRNPGDLEKAITTVQRVQQELGNASQTGVDASSRKEAFLIWCDNWATPQLSNHFPATEDLFAEIAESYYRIGTLPPMPFSQLNGMLTREFKAWESRLDKVLGELAGLEAFLRQPGKIVVLDTSALMEGVFFTEFDWHTLDPSLAADAVRLVVPSLVTEELDELKRRSGERQRAQARKVLAALWELHRAAPAKAAALPRHSDVTIEVLLDSGWHHRMPNNDGEIIDQAVAVKELTGQPLILAAGDYAQLYRAAPVALTAILMPRP